MRKLFLTFFFGFMMTVNFNAQTQDLDTSDRITIVENINKYAIGIDTKDYELFSQGDTAWSANEDKEIIYAMIKGNEMIIKGISSRGTLTTDTYTLTGFTTAHNKLKKDC